MHLYQAYTVNPSFLGELSDAELQSRASRFPLDAGIHFLSSRHGSKESIHSFSLRNQDRLLGKEKALAFFNAVQPAAQVNDMNEQQVTEITGETNSGTLSTAEHVSIVENTDILSQGTEEKPEHNAELIQQGEGNHDQLDDTPRQTTSKKAKKNKRFKLKEFSGISPYGLWLLSFQEESLDKKLKREAKEAKKRALEENARKSVTPAPGVISESLADILTGQGHLDAAKKMYTQLMLKYPEKSSYFAAKIENLTKNI